MADISLVTAGRVEVVASIRQRTYVAGEDITAGAPVQLNSSGKAVNSDANGSSPLNTAPKGIATRTVKSGESVTCLAEGILDGYDLSSQAYGTRIFVSDTAGALADAAGTASLPIGFVDSASGNPVTGSHDKVLNVNLPA